MSVDKEQVVAALAKVPSPDGAPLTEARVLSDVVVSDGKVFFSLTVDASAVKAWEPVRMAAEKAQYDKLSQQALSVGAKTFGETSEDENDIYLGGTSNIMDQPEFMSNLDQMKELFKAFEEKNRLISLLDKCLDEPGVHVIIGSETPFKDIRECSFVTHTYSYDNRTLGVLGVVGPKRMVYPRVMAIVDHTANIVSKILTQQ